MALSHKDLRRLAIETSGILKKEDPVVHLKSANAMIVGDIHGNLKALEYILKMRRELKCQKIVFLGDYVDRGMDSVAVISRLFDLKLNEPESILLLRGNHETIKMNSIYGFYDEVADQKAFLATNRAFEELPVAALINNSVFCVHGGIPGPVYLENISKEESFCYLWNDPSLSPGMTASTRGLGPQCFGPDVFTRFMEYNDLSLMIRAHSALYEGYAWWFDNKLLSLFSSPEYAGNNNNAAFALLKNGEVTVYLFGPVENTETNYSFIDKRTYTCNNF